MPSEYVEAFFRHTLTPGFNFFDVSRSSHQFLAVGPYIAILRHTIREPCLRDCFLSLIVDAGRTGTQATATEDL